MVDVLVCRHNMLDVSYILVDSEFATGQRCDLCRIVYSVDGP